MVAYLAAWRAVSKAFLTVLRDLKRVVSRVAYKVVL